MSSNPLMDEAFLKVLDVLSRGQIPAHSIALSFSAAERCWVLNVTVIKSEALEAIGSALGLGLTERIGRTTIARVGELCGVPLRITLIGSEKAHVPPSVRLRPGAFVGATEVDAPESLLDLLSS